MITDDVVVSVDNPDRLLKPGMTASARIVTQRRDQVLRVPDPALRYVPTGTAEHGSDATTTPTTNARRDPARTGRPAQVWILRDGRPQRVPVVTGLDDDAFAEILQGDLRDGDAVIVSERSGGTRTTAGGAQTGPRLPRL